MIVFSRLKCPAQLYKHGDENENRVDDYDNDDRAACVCKNHLLYNYWCMMTKREKRAVFKRVQKRILSMKFKSL